MDKIDDELRKKYIYFSSIILTSDEKKNEIEIHSRYLAFWNLENVYDIKNEKQLLKNIMVNKAKENTIKIIEEKFNDDDKNKIYRRAKILSDKKYIEKINKIKNKLIEIDKRSNLLYDKCKDTNIKLLNPPEWLNYQNIMRRKWELFQKQLIDVENDFQNLIINENVRKYMEWMYISYPPKWGEKIKEEYFDMAELYYELTN